MLRYLISIREGKNHPFTPNRYDTVNTLQCVSLYLLYRYECVSSMKYKCRYVEESVSPTVPMKIRFTTHCMNLGLLTSVSHVKQSL